MNVTRKIAKLDLFVCLCVCMWVCILVDEVAHFGWVGCKQTNKIKGTNGNELYWYIFGGWGGSWLTRLMRLMELNCTYFCHCVSLMNVFVGWWDEYRLFGLMWLIGINFISAVLMLRASYLFCNVWWLLSIEIWFLLLECRSGNRFGFNVSRLRSIGFGLLALEHWKCKKFESHV
jgi:hypothetical protein